MTYITYDEIASLTEQLSYRDKLRLAQLLIQFARKEAEEDLIEIWIYIAQDNPGAADSVLDDIEERFYALADNPLMGRLRPNIAPELRYIYGE
jgi:hypothetical protein